MARKGGLITSGKHETPSARTGFQPHRVLVDRCFAMKQTHQERGIKSLSNVYVEEGFDSKIAQGNGMIILLVPLSYCDIAMRLSSKPKKDSSGRLTCPSELSDVRSTGKE